MIMRLVLALAGLSICAQDPRAIIEKSLRGDQRDDDLARH